MEQENKTMKVLGGVVGLTQQPAALNRFCLTTPILSQLSQEFLQRNNIGVYNRKYHYQLTGSTCDRIHTNATKIEKMLVTFSVGFQSSNEVVNLVSKAVLPSTSANELLDHKNIRLSMYQHFISERINGSTSVWSPMKKRNLKTFKTQVKTFKSKVGEKLIQLKEEKSFMSRFLVTARKRPELELDHCIGNFELSVVPKSLFTVDGQPLPCLDKLKRHIEELLARGDSTTDVQPNSAIVIDAMAVVNEIVKDKTMKQCLLGIINISIL